MRHGFDGVVIGAERAGKELLAVAGGAQCAHLQRNAARRVRIFELHERLARHVDGFALVRGVKRVDRRAVYIQQHKLRGGAARIDAHVNRKRGSCGKSGRLDSFEGVGALEGAALVIRFKKRRYGCVRALRMLGHGVELARDAFEVARRCRILTLRAHEPQRRAARDDGLRMLGDDDLVGVEPEAFGEHAHERAIERERSALEHHG